MTTDNIDAVRACQDGFQAAPDSTIVLGFDGFVDIIHEMVDNRHSADEYDRIESLQSLGERILSSADQNSSQTIEWVPKSTGPGGFTVHCAKALRALNTDVELIGTFGQPIGDPFVSSFSQECLWSVGEPTETHAIEFGDAKLILINSRTQLVLGWSHLVERLGSDELVAAVDGCDVLGIGTWGKIPNSPSIWHGLCDYVFPCLEDPPADLLLDVGNVRMLDGQAIIDGAERLQKLNATVPVTVSANRGETNHLAAQLFGQKPTSFHEAAVTARNALGVSRFIGHNDSRVVLATSAGATHISTPVVDDPAMLLSAGDKFNAGIIHGLSVGLRSQALLYAGDAVAGFFVKHGRVPTLDEVQAHLDAYPSVGNA